MARWRLMNPHYLNVPGTEWEYVEISRSTGKQARLRYPVPMFLNPGDMADHNYPGEIVVCHAKPGEKVSKFHPKDIIFTGEPTPDMEPMDEEAEKISESLREKWVHAIESLPANGGFGDYSQSLFSKFESQLTEAINRVGSIPKAQPYANTSVKTEDFLLLKKQVEELTKQNSALLAKLSVKPAEGAGK